MTTLAQKIQAILSENKEDITEAKSAEELLKAASSYEGGKGGKEDKEPDEDDNEPDEDDEESDDTDTSKDKAEVKEELTTVPGTGKSLVNTTDTKGTSTDAKAASQQSKYNKGTKQGKLSPVGDADAKEDKASMETTKIKAGYSDMSSMSKLKAEAFEALFSGETLTEEFKTKAEAIFEAAVEQVSESKIKALQEEYQLQLTEAVEEVKGELVEQIDGYLDHVVEQWMEDNAVALESGIKVEMVSSFMNNLKQVFEEHYIEVPESKTDVVEEQAQAIETLQIELAEANAIAEAAKNEANVLKCEAIIAECSIGLTAIESEKLYSLAENVEFDTDEEFAAKVNALKEAYFKAGTSAKTKSQDTTNQTTVVSESHSDVNAVLKALRQDSKLIKSSN